MTICANAAVRLIILEMADSEGFIGLEEQRKSVTAGGRSCNSRATPLSGSSNTDSVYSDSQGMVGATK